MDNDAQTGTGVVTTETERKYRVPAGVEVPDLAGIGPIGVPRIDTLVATYYDTPDFALLAARATLRRRTGGQDAGWHLKTPGTGDVRGEHRLPLETGRRVPFAFRAEFAEVLEEKPLLPIVELTTVRTTTEHFDDEGRVRAEICSDRVSAVVLRRDVDLDLDWHEVEIELPAGEPIATFGLIEPVLTEAGIERTDAPSKLAHILATVPPAPAVDLDDAAADAVVSIMARHFGKLQALEGDLIANAPDAVHQSRVALRRMRSLVQGYRRVFDRQDAVRLRGELRWAGEQLGEARDAEVLVEKFAELFDACAEGEIVGPIRKRVEGSLGRRHAQALTHLRRVVASPRWDALHLLASEFILDPPASRRGRRPAFGVLPKLAADTIDLVRERTDAARADETNLDAWHEVRKGAKRVRYSYEVLEQLGDDDAKPTRQAWKEVAEDFGAVQDAVILDEQLQRFERAATAAGEPIDTYELLRGRFETDRDAELARVRTLLDELLAE